MLQTLSGQFRGLAQGNYARDILGAGATRTLVASAIKHRLKLCALAHVERPNPLRRVHLVSGDGEQIASDFLNVN